MIPRRWLPPVALILSLSAPSFSNPWTSGVVDQVNEGCKTGNPYLTTTRQYGGVYSSWFAAMPALVAVHDSRDDVARYRYPNNAEQITIASVKDVGAIFGLAYDWRRTVLYAASYYIASFGYGPKGPGYIYAADLETMKLRNGFALQAGPDFHDFRPGRTDMVPEHMAGKAGLGDIDVDESANDLFVVNLFDRRIYRFALPDLTPRGWFDAGGIHEGWGANARPFGLAVRDGWLFHGVVDSREDDTLPGALSAHVFRSRFDGSELTEVLSFEFNYPTSPPWEPWSDTISYKLETLTKRQPLIVDIVFRENGDMIIGLSSRTQAMAPLLYNVGDIILARKVGSQAWIAVLDTETYVDDVVSPSGKLIMEASHGSLASLVDGQMTATTGTYPYLGVAWYDNDSGRIAGPVDGTEMVVTDFAGLGDLEALCAVSPPPSRTPSPTSPASPTATSTLTSTPTPSPSQTSPPTPTATASLNRVFLPVADRLYCMEREIRADVVVILDASTSMARITTDGRSKLEVVIDTMRTFAEQLDLDSEAVQVGIVGFNNQAWTEGRLGSNLSGLSEALRRLPSRLAEGTRLDLGLRAGEALLFSQPGARVGVRKVAILMTDGLPNLVPTAEDGRQDTTVLRAADHLRTSGALVFSIGFGNPGDFDPVLLTGIAGNSDRFFQTPDSEDLQQIFSGIAARIPCQ